jgi:hypothetical protein
MYGSKLYTARFLAYILISYLAIGSLVDPGCSVATASNYPVVQEGHGTFRSTKSQEITELRINGFQSASDSETEQKSIQVVNASKVGDKNETNTILESGVSTDVESRWRIGHGFISVTEMARRRFDDRLDAMDKMIIRNTLPLVGLTSIVPLLQSADLFWVNQLGDTLAVSAQSAANTLYQFSFGLFSFLPSVSATLVSKNFANNDFEKTESTMITALLFGVAASSVISITIFASPSRYLGAVLKGTTRCNQTNRQSEPHQSNILAQRRG